MPLISIIVPVYNTEKYLPKCLDSVLNQNNENIEIIVVNDCSPNNCNEIVNDYIKKYDNIKLIENKNNLGLYNTRLVGIKEAKGKYVMHVDSDDYILPNSLNELIKIINEDDYDIIAFNCLIEDDKGNIYESPPQNKILQEKIIYDKNEMYEELFLGSLPESNATKVFKRELYSCLDYVNRNIVFQEDYLAIIRLIFSSKAIRLTSKECYIYYQRSESSTKFQNMNYKQRVKTLGDLIFVNENIVKFFKDENLNSYFSMIRHRENVYYNWIYNDMISNINDNEEKEIKDLIFKAFPLISPNLKILDRINKSSDNNCFISIIIPVFNTEKYLKRCLDSIVNQTFKDMEIILVDDCSSGNCYEIFEEYRKNNKNIRYVKNEKNLGSAWSRLNGLSYAKGEYIHFVDSDDWVFEDCYLKIYKYLGNKYDCLHFDGIYAYDDKTTKRIKFQISENTELIGKRKAFEDMFVNDSRRRTLWCRVFRKNICLKAAQYMPKSHLSVADDWILNLFALFFVKKYRSVSDIFYYYFQDNPNAMTAVVENKKDVKFSVDKLDNALRQTYDSYNGVVNFLEQNKVWEKYGALWQLYITRDIQYQFLNPYKNLENYLLDLQKENKEQYINESVKLFKLHYIKVSYLLKFIQSNLYKSNGGNINVLIYLIHKYKNSFKSFTQNIFHYLFSVNRNYDRITIYFLGFRITLKRNVKYE
ncbi:glycosyltransferase family 2 protein [Brachyspira catarrhinii]|uniref:Glycosyltransferase family 2 protein n=1 Tax=Brachyspira catarrhinii TaxID=2528966 RepID=A0ABY2TS61_9SPIR|nr:glycosyltransferase family 2 protein [Brachyspira catarrhinii]TKZ35604.1 glycosyltransferase family 2 protein [Brachyspira catarrhinii]